VVLGPGELGLLASQHHAQVTVFRRPRVAILSTGDELIDVSDAPQPGKIVNSNAYALAAQVREAGGEPWILPNCGDDLERIVQLVRAGLRADVLLSVGGVSVGEYDLMGQAFVRAGVTQGFWKVAIKPGKPLSFGVKDDTPVIGLPGNPVSAMVTFEVFVRPGLRKMLGDPQPFRAHGRVRLAHPHRHRTGRTELARARLERRDGELIADLRRLQGSGSLPSMVGVDAYVVLAADQEQFAADATLPALFVREVTGSASHPWS
jgi:molybdopterin molybdotransferase